jgi:CheY-like chemotaxis protein
MALTIMVVDDNDDVRCATAAILSRNGHKVITAGNGTTAIGLVREMRCSLNLLLTDLQMPGMDGYDVISEVRAICPQVAVLVMTGSNAEVEGVPILRKPFTVHGLLAAIEDVASGVET